MFISSVVHNIFEDDQHIYRGANSFSVTFSFSANNVAFRKTKKNGNFTKHEKFCKSEVRPKKNSPGPGTQVAPVLATSLHVKET